MHLRRFFAGRLFKVGLCSFPHRNDTCACEAERGRSRSLSPPLSDTAGKQNKTKKIGRVGGVKNRSVHAGAP